MSTSTFNRLLRVSAIEVLTSANDSRAHGVGDACFKRDASMLLRS